jgi:hypothetical protein
MTEKWKQVPPALPARALAPARLLYGSVEKGMQPTMARLTLASKIVTIT